MKKSKLIAFLFCACFSFGFAACGGGGGSDDGSDPTLTDGTDPTAQNDPISTNPIARSQETFGVDGNLWKPAGDGHGAGAGNLVVLLSSKFTEEFDSCEIRLNTGEVRQLLCINNQPWTHTPYSCFSNGNRQTWRADFRCSSAGEVSVLCKEEQQEVLFTVPESVRHQVCSRFG